ncbi:hypothetical protein KSF_007620 [Reticulibacter mediterranei]|uniref:Uncharacterized protein n=1 Tax=Reticulibacter mediterranei TaxID=2778369 RepID=A0A8J3MX95_9CHLR|nr:hypothetical protein KSF_007620 [Reticulibacter mediterranei]
MTLSELEQWQEAFEQFHARFSDLFERSESREQAKKYLRGLLATVPRKNSWHLAEVVGDGIEDSDAMAFVPRALGCRSRAGSLRAVCHRDLWG